MADPSNSSPLSYRFVDPRGGSQLSLPPHFLESSFYLSLPLEFSIFIMDEIAPEYDVVVLGTGMLLPRHPPQTSTTDHFLSGLTECVLSG